MKKLLLIGGIFFSCLMVTSCGSSSEPDSDFTPKPIVVDIVGTWLSSASEENNWISYEFTSSARVNVEEMNNGRIQKGSGFYTIEENNALTASYTNGLTTRYLDWIFTSSSAFQIDYDLYDNDKYLGKYSLYRILSSCEIEVGKSILPDYKLICGSSNHSEYYSITPNVVKVDETTGALTGISAGTGFIQFKSANGYAVLKVLVSNSSKTFAEKILGTWIYENLSEKEWQSTTYAADDYVYVAWSFYYNKKYYNETADGNFSISDGDVLKFKVVTPYGQKYNQEWYTEEINDLIWTYRSYSDGTSNGIYTGQRLVGSITLQIGESGTPDYTSFMDGYQITGYSMHNDAIASVDSSTGLVTAVAEGRTYVNVETNLGAAVVEVKVE